MMRRIASGWPQTSVIRIEYYVARLSVGLAQNDVCNHIALLPREATIHLQYDVAATICVLMYHNCELSLGTNVIHYNVYTSSLPEQLEINTYIFIFCISAKTGSSSSREHFFFLSSSAPVNWPFYHVCKTLTSIQQQ